MVMTNKITARRDPGKETRALRRWIILAGTATAVLWMWAELGHSVTGKPDEAGSKPRQSAEDYVRLHRPEFMKGTQARHGTVFIVDPADFGCPPCFEDFERLLGNLMVLAGPEASKRILLLVRQGAGGAWNDSTAVRRWADIQGFTVPLEMVPDTTYRGFGFHKTGVIVVDGSIKSILAKEIPMGHNTHAEIRSRMEECNRVADP